MILYLLIFINNIGYSFTRTHEEDEVPLVDKNIIGDIVLVASTIKDVNSHDKLGSYGLLKEVDYMYDEEEIPIVSSTKKVPNYEPVIPPRIDEQKFKETKIDCDAFTIYATNCTLQSTLMYNSSKKLPPMPAEMKDWCRAIRHVTNCSVAWNNECKDVTESYFNEQSIKGHMHVVNSICNEHFLEDYDKLHWCIKKATHLWHACYVTFKKLVDEQKNSTLDWTHYETHFHLCCARAKFRRCTLEAVFNQSLCEHGDALRLQNFSVIISEGEVFQDCDRNMMYSNCPGGDPRPSPTFLATLMDTNYFDPISRRVFVSSRSENNILHSVFVLLFLINILVYIFVLL